MTMDNVRRLMVRIGTDKDLRDRLSRARDQAGREEVLAAEGLHFTNEEFDAIIDHLHVQCQTHEQAERFFDFRNWWEFLRRT